VAESVGVNFPAPDWGAPFENPNETFLRRKNKKHFCVLPLVGVEQDSSQGG
jgi:hypothetical protein